MLLLIEADLVFYKRCSKMNLMRALAFSNGKVILILLIKVVAFHIGFTTIHIKRLAL